MRATASVPFGAIGGVLCRPCCVIPIVLSLGGLGSAAAGEFIAQYRPVLIGVGGCLLLVSMGMAFHRQGGWVAKAITGGAALAAFSLVRLHWGLTCFENL